MNRKQKKILTRIIISLCLTIVLNIVKTYGVLRFALFLLTYLVIGYDILRKALRGIINGRVFDENFLMAIATVGAFGLAVYSGSGDYNEAVAVMLFYQTGELFQSCAVGKSRKNIASLMDIRPDSVHIEKDGSLVCAEASTIEIGTVITVKPGEKIAIDGVVEEGESSLDTKALTGEAMPVWVKAGDEALSGCINIGSALKIRTTKRFEDSTVSKILELVENASGRKSRAEKFISKFSMVYTPTVCILALCLAVFPPLFMWVFMGVAPWSVWLYRALTFLVISCPCALVISIPLSFFASIGGASREGILIKGSNYIESLSRVGSVAFDKTGTLTKGEFAVKDTVPYNTDKDRLMYFASMAEFSSTHPIAVSILKAYSKKGDISNVKIIEEHGGMGVTAVVDETPCAVGNAKLMEKLGIEIPDISPSLAAVHVAIGGEYAGYILIADEIKENAISMVSALSKLGIKKTAMLTGDNRKTAEEIAKKLGIDTVISELLPSGKVEALEKIMKSTPKNKTTVYAGDGINDAPVLARSDVGIAMGALGSDSAIEAADIVIMDDDPKKIVKAICIARKCMNIVRQNIVFSLFIKFSCLALASVGIADMRLGIFADVGVMVIAVLNSMRALKATRD